MKNLKNLILLNIVLLFTSGYKKSSFPKLTQIHPSLYEEPIQDDLNKSEEFSFNYRNSNFNVEKKANYKINGLVVTHNDISSIFDIYHTKDSVDTKDLCIIWGDNLKNEDFKKVSYSSGSWTCYFKYNGGIKFHHNKLSNNHLITNNNEVREKISMIGVGDQISINGFLVNYSDSKNPSFIRKTSLSREDKGKTACEVLFVNDVTILSNKNKIWRDLYKYLKLSLVFLILFPVVRILLKEHLKI